MTEPGTAVVLDTAVVLAALEAEDAAVEAAINQAQNAVTALVTGFQDWYDSDGVTGFCNTVSEVVQGFSQGVARTSDAFLSRTISVMTGKIFFPAGVIKQAIAGPRALALRKIPKSAGILNGDREGVTRPGVYGRVADTFRYQRSTIDRALLEAVRTGKLPPDLADPQSAAINRARQAVDTDLKLARRAQMRRTLSKAADEGLVTGYRRVIHPEVSRGGTCGLCIAASTRKYRVEELMALHGGCHCTQLPIVGGADPGLEINEAAYVEAERLTGGQTSRQALAKTRFRVDQHGELGPVLAPADEPIRTAREVKRATNKVTKPKTIEQKIRTLENKRRTMQTELDGLQGRIKSGELDSEQWQGMVEQFDQRIAELGDEAAALEQRTEAT